MYKLMDMEPPVIKVKKKKKAPPLKIDRTGESDPARYTGLKMGQVLDDDAMGKALEEFNRKKREGLELRPKLEEEKFVKPFAGKVFCALSIVALACRDYLIKFILSLFYFLYR